MLYIFQMFDMIAQESLSSPAILKLEMLMSRLAQNRPQSVSSWGQLSTTNSMWKWFSHILIFVQYVSITISDIIQMSILLHTDTQKTHMYTYIYIYMYVLYIYICMYVLYIIYIYIHIPVHMYELPHTHHPTPEKCPRPRWGSVSSGSPPPIHPVVRQPLHGSIGILWDLRIWLCYYLNLSHITCRYH